ncbi:RidA family protein [Synechococcus sp. R55.6]|uniref:Rid family hydrolase n=1 Tax=unclassified Synechococcus TaxID=2626047 RepID=UPI0039C4AF0F
MPKVAIAPAGYPAIAPYSPGVKVGNTLYISGTLALDPEGKTVGSDIATQTRVVLDLIKSVVTEAGGTMEDIVFCSVFLTDYANYAGMNAVYKEYFPGVLPARFVVKADLVRPDLLVEIAAVAHIGA